MNVQKAEPQCMALVAAIALQWTEIEQALIDLLGNALGSSWMQGANVVAGRYNLVARVALQQSETIRTRLKLMDATLKPMLADTPLAARWETLTSDLQKRARERNKVVHARWGYSDEAPGALINDAGEKRELWTEADFKNVLDRIVALWRSILTFSHEIGKAKIEGDILAFGSESPEGADVPANLPDLGYHGLGVDASEAERTAKAALVLVVNLLRDLRGRGLVRQDTLEMNFENASAVSQPNVGSNLEHVLFAHLRDDQKERQYRNRGIDSEEGGTA